MSTVSIEQNLTEGNVAKLLIRFAIPFMLSTFVQALYNVADALIVGNFVGSVGVSGVNIGGQVTFIATNIVIGISIGGSVAIGQYLGSGDRKGLNETIKTLILSLGCGNCNYGSDAASGRHHPPPAQHTGGVIQTGPGLPGITLLGIIFIFGYNAFAAILRGMGDSRRPMMFILSACFLNIILDLIFVGAMGMEAAGAALATIISQAVSVIACIIYLKRINFEFDFKISSLRLYKERFLVIMKVGIPVSIQNVITNFSFLVLTTIANGMGVDASAAIGIVGKYNGFAILPAIAVGSSVSAMVAQNIGAERHDRARKTFHVGLMLSYAISLVVFIITRLFPEQILLMFGNEPGMIAAGTEYIQTFSFDYLIVPLVFCLNGLITGSGHTIISSIGSIMSSLGLRAPLAILFCIVLDKGMRGLGMAGPLAAAGSAVFLFAYYLTGKWKASTITPNVTFR